MSKSQGRVLVLCKIKEKIRHIYEKIYLLPSFVRGLWVLMWQEGAKLGGEERKP